LEGGPLDNVQMIYNIGRRDQEGNY
jgi:hypothetical protein